MLIISTRRTYASRDATSSSDAARFLQYRKWQQCRAVKSRCHSDFSNDGTTWALRANHLPPRRWWPRRSKASKVLSNGVLPTWTLRFEDDSRRQKRRNSMNALTMRLSPLLVVSPRARRSSKPNGVQRFDRREATRVRGCVPVLEVR